MTTSGSVRAILWAIAAGFWVSSAIAADAGASAPLVGRWRSLENSEGGIGALFEFKEGGGLSYSPGAVLEMPYRVEGDKLLLPPEIRSGPERTLQMDWLSDDSVRLSAKGSPNIVLVRRSAKPGDKKSILGEFSGQQDVEGRTMDVVYLFGPEGKVLLLMPFVKTQGSYTVDGAKIRMAVPDRWSAEGTFKVDGDTLTLSIADPKKGTKDSRYARY